MKGVLSGQRFWRLTNCCKDRDRFSCEIVIGFLFLELKETVRVRVEYIVVGFEGNVYC